MVYRTSGTGAPDIVVEKWKSARGGKRERTRYSRYAKATFRKDRPQSRSIGWSGVPGSVRSSLPERLQNEGYRAASRPPAKGE
jgi:hypothetical protein